MPFANVDGLQVHYLEEGHGTAVVLIHGWGMSGESWDDVMAALGPGYRCLALDLPGYGRSQQSERVSVQDYAGVVDAFCRELELSDVTLMGHSMGGMITLLTTLEHPRSVGRLATVGAVITGELSPLIRWWLCPGLRLAAISGFGPRFYSFVAGIRPYMRWLVGKTWYGGPDCLDAPYFPRRLAVLMRTDTIITRLRNLPSLTGTNLLPRLGEITAPALLIHGEKDGTVPAIQAHMAVERMPNAELKIIPGAGHWPMDERPGLFMSALLDWLDRTQGR
jgi:pimeloyl-ACP methyl ester carboxylesterase